MHFSLLLGLPQNMLSFNFPSSIAPAMGISRRLLQLFRAVFQGRGIEIGEGSRLKKYRVVLQDGDSLKIGNHCMIEGKFMSDRPGARFEIGDRTFIGKSLFVAANRISIGSDVLISWGVTVVDHDSHAVDFDLRRHDVAGWLMGEKDWSNVAIAPVKIGDKVWIGFGASILKGIEIGEGAIVAAGSVVTKNVAPWTLVGGNPARVIRTLEPAQ